MKNIGFYNSWKTTINQKIDVGNKVKLSTVFGIIDFVVMIIDANIATLENGSEVIKLKKISENKWEYNNTTLSKNFKCHIHISDIQHHISKSNIGFTKKY